MVLLIKLGDKMKKILLVVIITALMIVSSMLVCSFFKNDKKEQKEFIVDVPIPLGKEVTTIKEGLDIAYDLAKRWDKNALPVHIIARFEEEQHIKDRKGRIIYKFDVDNLGLFGNLGKTCYVELSLIKQKIEDFVSYGEAPDIGHDSPADFYKANIDINDVFEIIELKLGKETFYKYEKPTVIISAGEEAWIFDFYSEERKIYEIRIDPNKGEIIDIIEENS